MSRIATSFGRLGLPARVEAELDRARHLVDVLPARTRRADEVFDDLALVNEEIAGLHGAYRHSRTSTNRPAIAAAAAIAGDTRCVRPL